MDRQLSELIVFVGGVRVRLWYQPSTRTYIGERDGGYRVQLADPEAVLAALLAAARVSHAA